MWMRLASLVKYGRARGLRRRAPALTTVIEGARVLLRLPDSADWWGWHRARSHNRDYLMPWEPTWNAAALTHKSYINFVRRAWCDWRDDRAYTFLIFRRDAGIAQTPIGGVTLMNVERHEEGNHHAVLGYWLAKDYAGLGLMTEAAGLVCAFAFERLGLDYLTATCMPTNNPSQRVLTKLGFVAGERLPNYMAINGRPEDHVAWRRNR